MKKKHIILIAIAASVAAFGVTTGYLKSISGTVVDAETGKPVEGAIVLAEWTRRQGVGDYHTVSVRASEVITDKEGKFHVLGPLHPFVDPPDVTVYKKEYVAWNNKRIFPEYKNRHKSEDMYQEIKLEKFNNSYSYERHVSFIRLCTSWVLADHKKRKFEASYQWEVDLARKEEMRGK